MTSSPNLRRDRQPETFVVSSSILASWLSGDFRNVDSIKALVFEAGLELREIPSHFFGRFRSLKSICIPASVEVIRKEVFLPGPSWILGTSLQTLTFEAGSKLQRIETRAVSECSLLKSICLPASVTEIGGGAFSKSGICEISLEADNRHFVVFDDFLMDFERICVIQYFGRESDLIIPSNVEILRTYSFAFVRSLRTVKFSPGSKLRSIEASAFENCVSLRSLSIPASVTMIGRRCFAGPLSSLSVVEFEAGSKLRQIDEGAFAGCLCLKSIIVPSSVQTLGRECFKGCRVLETVKFFPDSELVRLEPFAFLDCSSLSSLFIPASVEFIRLSCFSGCDSLSTITFGSPARIRELLDLPSHCSGFQQIPDSVESLVYHACCRPGKYYALAFSNESKLVNISLSRPRVRMHLRTFVHVSSRMLKVFRSDLEFYD
jgi:hypothetical protein